MNHKFSLLLTVLLVITIVVCSCTSSQKGSMYTTQKATPIPTTLLPTSTPKYVAGDIINDKPTHSDPLMMIISYDSRTDEYEINYIFKNNDGTWGHFANNKTSWYSRDFIESYKPILIDHIDVSRVTPGYKYIPSTITASPTNTAISSSIPRFKAGDVVTPNTDLYDMIYTNWGYVIKQYDSATDSYIVNTVQWSTGSWDVYNVVHSENRIDFDSKKYCYKVGEINRNPPKPYGGIAIYVRYSGSWKGAYSDNSGLLKAVEGTGPAVFTIEHPSYPVTASFSKTDKSYDELNVFSYAGDICDDDTTTTGSASIVCHEWHAFCIYSDKCVNIYPNGP